MHRLSDYISTDADRLTYRKWLRGVAIFYGFLGLLVVSFVAVRNYQTDLSRYAATAAPTTAMIAINNNRAH